jgi:hypothetical protein
MMQERSLYETESSAEIHELQVERDYQPSRWEQAQILAESGVKEWKRMQLGKKREKKAEQQAECVTNLDKATNGGSIRDLQAAMTNARQHNVDVPSGAVARQQDMQKAHEAIADAISGAGDLQAAIEACKVLRVDFPMDNSNMKYYYRLLRRHKALEMAAHDGQLSLQFREGACFNFRKLVDAKQMLSLEEKFSPLCQAQAQLCHLELFANGLFHYCLEAGGWVGPRNRHLGIWPNRLTLMGSWVYMGSWRSYELIVSKAFAEEVPFGCRGPWKECKELRSSFKSVSVVDLSPEMFGGRPLTLEVEEETSAWMSWSRRFVVKCCREQRTMVHVKETIRKLKSMCLALESTVYERHRS